ncbi:MAG TPA: SpvB/TcaC N-terminal domain-containing protein, partial [Polyangiaceae bacterium]|nr:SpvB/TcaC N-terminal domain-containing protein [Polyangiaceae bacterium]
MGLRGFLLLVWVLACAVFPGGCTCAVDPPPPPRGLIACVPQHPTRATVAPAKAADAVETVAAGSTPGSFSVTSTGEASFVMPLVPVPGRAGAGMEPQMALAYSSHGGDGLVGRGFSITGSSLITRCPSDLARDGEIRGVRYDAGDKLCLDSKRLVVVGEESGRIEYRTVPDTHVKVLGHDPDDEGMPRWFEAFLPSGLVVEYGTTEGTRPRGPKGNPRAWLSAFARDGRGNAIDFAYCFAEADGYTAEFALDEIRYTRFEGSPALEATRAVKLVYGTADEIRTIYSGGMALQSSLRLDEVQMVGPGDVLVRRYAFRFEQSPTTNRSLLSQVEECAGDGVCKPPTRFQYKSDPAGFKRIKTSIAAPTSRRASPMLVDFTGDGLVDLVVPDTNPALSTPQNPITEWRVAQNLGEGASPPFFANTNLAFSQEWPMVADPIGPADSSSIQPELGTAIDYDQDGRSDVWLHDVYGGSVNETVLLARPDGTFDLHDTGIRRPFPLGSAPKPPELTSPGASVHLADLDGDGVADRIACEDHGADAEDVPGEPVWRVHLWRPKQDAAS